jgi:hypothetical protein
MERQVLPASRLSAATDIVHGTTSPVLVSRIVNTRAFVSSVAPPTLS